MKTSIVFSILFVTENFCGGIQINKTDSCPMTEAQWNKKKEEVTCQEGEGYFCSLNKNNTFITGCLPAIISTINPNVVNCPFVVTAMDRVSLPYEGKYTPCNITLIGCPQNNHPGYTILELYKYPLCLLRPEDRDHNITSYPDTTTKSLFTLSTVESRNTTINNRREDKESINGAVIAAIVISIVIVLSSVAIAVHFKLWKRRAPNKGFLQFVQDLVRCNTCRFGYSTTSTNDDRHAEELHVQEVPSRQGSDSGSSSGESVHDVIDESEQLIQRSGKDGLIIIIKRGDEEELRRCIQGVLKEIRKKKSVSLTVENVKEALCLWIKMWDRPQPLVEFCTLLCALDNDIILFDLLIQPENYNYSISMLVYAGRLKRKDTVSFLLERKPTLSLPTTDKDDNSILHYVVAMKSLELTKKVLQLDHTLLDNRNIDNKTPFIMAAEFGCADIVQFLLEQRADVRDENYTFEKITELCIENMWKEIFDSLLLQNEHLLLLHKEKKEYCHIFQAGKVVRSILPLYNEELDHFVESTLRPFPDMLTNSAYYLRKHPLIWTVGTKNVKAIELLLSKTKPKPEDLLNITDNAHNNLLFLCMSNKVPVEILRNESLLSLINSKDNYNRSPIMRAVKLARGDYFDKFLDHQETRLHHRDENGENILHLAVKKRSYRTTKKLLDHRDKDLLLCGNNENMTPLMLAISLISGSRILTLLLERGSEINDVDKNGKTVFHLCAETYQTYRKYQESKPESANSSKTVKNDKEDKKKEKDWKQERVNSIKVLLKCEKFRMSRHLLKVKDRQGNTPSDIALANNDTECLELFQESLSSEMTEDIECNGFDRKTEL